jgi:hypothetical protein
MVVAAAKQIKIERCLPRKSVLIPLCRCPHFYYSPSTSAPISGLGVSSVSQLAHPTWLASARPSSLPLSWPRPSRVPLCLSFARVSLPVHLKPLAPHFNPPALPVHLKPPAVPVRLKPPALPVCLKPPNPRRGCRPRARPPRRSQRDLEPRPQTPAQGRGRLARR